MVRLVGACRSSLRCELYSSCKADPSCDYPNCCINTAQDGCYLGDYVDFRESREDCKAQCEADVQCTGYEYQEASVNGACERHKTPITHVVAATGGFECYVKNASPLQL